MKFIFSGSVSADGLLLRSSTCLWSNVPNKQCEPCRALRRVLANRLSSQIFHVSSPFNVKSLFKANQLIAHLTQENLNMKLQLSEKEKEKDFGLPSLLRKIQKRDPLFEKSFAYEKFHLFAKAAYFGNHIVFSFVEH